jgi:hypothetical protein
MALTKVAFDDCRLRCHDGFFRLLIVLSLAFALFAGLTTALLAADTERPALPGPGATSQPYVPPPLGLASGPATTVQPILRDADLTGPSYSSPGQSAPSTGPFCDMSCPAWTPDRASICNPTRNCVAGVPAYAPLFSPQAGNIPRPEPIQPLPDTYQSNLLVADSPMAFAIVRADVEVCRPNCPEWIAATGTIKPDTPAKLRKILNQAGKRRLPLVIDSRGGAVNAAIEMGRIIRKRGLDVAIGKTMYLGCTPGPKSCKPDFADGAYAGYAFPGGGICLSACPFFAAGGLKRLAGYEARVGIHQITTTVTNLMITYQTRYRIVNGKKKIIDRKVVSRKPTGTYETTEVRKGYRKQLVAYFVEMGVKPSLVDRMLAVSASDIYILQYNELSDFKFATDEGDSRAFTAGRICNRDPKPGNCVELKPVPPKV